MWNLPNICAVGPKSGSRKYRNTILALDRTVGKTNQCGQAPVVPQYIPHNQSEASRKSEQRQNGIKKGNFERTGTTS